MSDEIIDGIFMFCYIMDGMQSRLRRVIPQSGGWDDFGRIKE